METLAGKEASTESWRRFTVMDGMLVIVAMALGMTLSPWIAGWEVKRAIMGTLEGGIVAGPLLLLGQWLRGRRSALSAGEVLWLVPFAIQVVYVALVVALGTSEIGNEEIFVWMIVSVVLVAVQAVSTLVALSVLVLGLSKRRSEVACRWTDRLGSFLGFVAMPITVLCALIR
jgi:hypothetical protein